MDAPLHLQKRIKALVLLVVSSAFLSVVLASLWFFETLETLGAHSQHDAAGLLHLEQSLGQARTLVGGLAIALPLMALIGFVAMYRSLHQLRQQDRRTRTIFEAIGDAVVVVNTRGQVEFLNMAAQQLLGYPDSAAQGRPLADIFNIVDMHTGKPAPSPVDKVLHLGQTVNLTNGLQLRRPDGSHLIIEDSAAPVLDEQGQIAAVVMVFRDVSRRYAMMRELDHERKLYTQTFNQAAVGMAHVSLQGRWLKVNQKLCEFTGYSQAELLEKSFQGITHPEDLARDQQALRDVAKQNLDSYEAEKRYIHKDGHDIWAKLSVSMVRDAAGRAEFGISIIEDITTRKLAEQAAQESQLQFQTLFEQMPEGLLLIDEQLKVIDCNQEAIHQLGYDASTLQQLHVWDFEVQDDLAAIEQRKHHLIETGRDSFESRYRTRSGLVLDVNVSIQSVFMPDGRLVFQTLFRDISAEKQAMAQIEHMAYHDQLTGLANRRLLNDRMTQAIHATLRRGSQLAILYLDLDHFKLINDSLGHLVGDQLLQQVAQRLARLARAEDTVARMGGDEFVVMLGGIRGAADAAMLAERIIDELSAPIMVNDEELLTTPSIGISLCPQDGRDAEELLKHADAALYQAKQAGRCAHRFYTQALHDDARERLNIERLLHKAIERHEFELYYQPQVALNGEHIVGCEALIRWHHPSLGTVSPAQFIPIAEHSNLINQIGNWVMRQACQQARLWQLQGHRLKVSFNVSARQFMRPAELLDELRAALHDSGVDPQLMGIEITESLLLDPQHMGQVLHDICALGVQLSLDDFGTGYSSLSYLRRFPIHTLKIDQSFVSHSDQLEDDAEMVKTIIGMAHNLRMKLVAEGVETAEQGQLLQLYGCEAAQGYHYSRPVPVAEFETLLDRVAA
ncbi:EAL domain-containing protein [Rhodoferax sp.]|uniref:sensor domain-containing protein n=1 Tax=Rhodoferax sp. TaxID=50421 RepID=UPI002614B260|nr:EAL domain-containing protein [Rhodoferax sp.]MDD2924519.1 EAL domain-containing protein [Rhodoferax sp.]